jgi:hypothetical protein
MAALQEVEMGKDRKDGSAEHRASEIADYWTKLVEAGISVYEVPQVGQEHLSYRDAKGNRGALPGMIRSVCATDDEGTQFQITLFESSVTYIRATLVDRSKRLRSISPSTNPPGRQNRAGSDYVSET